MGMPAPDTVKRLVDRFDQDRKVFQSADYKEEQLRAEFLNPFFESLGWDVANKPALSLAEGAGLTEACPERSGRVAGATDCSARQQMYSPATCVG
jgi:hypothetical protein